MAETEASSGKAAPTNAFQNSFSAAKQDAEASKQAEKSGKKPQLHAENADKRWVVALHAAFESNMYDGIIALIVGVNFILLVIETDCEGRKLAVPAWVNVLNTVILVGFACELVVKLVVYRKSYFRSIWNIMDFLIVFFDLLSFCLSSLLSGMPTISIIRMVRLMRLGRSIQFLMLFPELGLLLSSIVGTLKSLFWGIILITMVLLLYGILAVQLIHPLNQEVTDAGLHEGCERCPRAFETVYQSMLTFFQQLVAGDSWGTVSLPICERSPAAWLFFTLVLVSLELLVMNVILAAVVDSAGQARTANLAILNKQKDEERRSYQAHLVGLCRELDGDGTGTLTQEEIQEGFTSNAEFYNIMDAMDIAPDDIGWVWGVLDVDGSGEVNYEEFATELFKMKEKDEHTMIVFIQHYVQEIRTQLRETLCILQQQQSGLSNGLPAPPLDQEYQKGSTANGLNATDCATSAFDFVKFQDDFSSELRESSRQIDAKLETTNQLINSMRAELSRSGEVRETTNQLINSMRAQLSASASDRMQQRDLQEQVPWNIWPTSRCSSTQRGKSDLIEGFVPQRLDKTWPERGPHDSLVVVPPSKSVLPGQ